MSLYKCSICRATDEDTDLDEDEVGEGYMCNNCLAHESTMVLVIKKMINKKETNE